MLDYLGLAHGSTIGRQSYREASSRGWNCARGRKCAAHPLADEPTGNLDLHTAEHVFHALSQLVKASGLAAIIATHNMDLAARMDRRVTLREGKILEMA